MSISTLIGNFWHFLGLYQKFFLRCLHIAIAILVITQILNSNGMGFTPTQQVRSDLLTEFFTWMHIAIGITLLCLCVALVVYCLATRGFRYFYPYLWGDFTQIRRDLKTITRFKLPESEPREGANKRGNSSRLTQSFHFFMFEPIFSPVNALNQPI